MATWTGGHQFEIFCARRTSCLGMSENLMFLSEKLHSKVVKFLREFSFMAMGRMWITVYQSELIKIH